MDLIETVLEFVIKVNAIAKQKDQTSTPQCCCSVLSITSYLDSLVLSEEEVARRDQDVDWIKKLKVLSQSANAIIAVPESSSESESSEENYESSYNSEFDGSIDGSEEERDCSCSSSCDCSD